MIKGSAKTILSQSLSLRSKERLAGVLLHDIVQTASNPDVPSLEDLFAAIDAFQVSLEDRIRQLKHTGQIIPAPRTPGCRTPCATWVMEAGTPWMNRKVEHIAMPGMISDEEIQYYEYVGSIYEGRGEIIELGPWLGKSTRHIMRGLDDNIEFADKRLHVFDDFIWRSSWMDQHVPRNERLQNHACFRHIFERYVREILPRLNVTRARIADYDGNEALPRVRWNGEPIEMMYIDCGRTIQVNEGWFEVFAPSFIPDVTLLIMQDWRLHRERPRKYYNQTLWFTSAHPELSLIHEIREGGVATFLYRGHAT
jgi:hypothetical protein